MSLSKSESAALAALDWLRECECIEPRDEGESLCMYCQILAAVRAALAVEREEPFRVTVGKGLVSMATADWEGRFGVVFIRNPEPIEPGTVTGKAGSEIPPREIVGFIECAGAEGTKVLLEEVEAAYRALGAGEATDE